MIGNGMRMRTERETDLLKRFSGNIPIPCPSKAISYFQVKWFLISQVKNFSSFTKSMSSRLCFKHCYRHVTASISGLDFQVWSSSFHGGNLYMHLDIIALAYPFWVYPLSVCLHCLLCSHCFSVLVFSYFSVPGIFSTLARCNFESLWPTLVIHRH